MSHLMKYHIMTDSIIRKMHYIYLNTILNFYKNNYDFNLWAHHVINKSLLCTKLYMSKSDSLHYFCNIHIKVAYFKAEDKRSKSTISIAPPCGHVIVTSVNWLLHAKASWKVKLECALLMTFSLRREREIKFIGLFENRGHRGQCSPYKPFNHNLYIGIIIFPHIDNPQSTGYN